MPSPTSRRGGHLSAGEACGPLWARHPAPEAIPAEQRLRRTIRYVHLNPCRAGLGTE